MTSKIKLETNNVKYESSKLGIWGTLGSGAGCEVDFIQTVLSSKDIDDIDLISDIPDSKKWKIKDLFQRNINQARVDGPLMEYLNDANRIKFFNPLTLIILPHDDKNQILKEIPYLKSVSKEEYIGLEFDSKEYEGFYKLGFNADIQLGKFSWDRDSCFIVAIDGQHRLSALKKLKRSGNSDIVKWKIPSVLLCLHKIAANGKLKVDLLEAVRKVFIDINNKAERISNARKILLNDSLVLDVVSQELVEYSPREIDKKYGKQDKMPLFFFDWRGDASLDNKKASNAAILSIEEINGNLSEYFKIPTEDSKKPKMPNWLSDASIPEGELSYKASVNLRKHIKSDFVPGFHLFLRSLTTFNNYINQLDSVFYDSKKKEQGRYCLEKEAFGGVDKWEEDYERYYSFTFTDEVKKHKETLPSLLQKDIGIRSIMYVYSNKRLFEKISKKKDPSMKDYSWSNHATVVSELINKLIEHGWFDTAGKIQKKYLDGIVQSVVDGNIINYRMSDASNAFGGFILRLAINLLGVAADDEEYSKEIQDIMDRLKACYLKDQKKLKRSLLVPTWKKTTQELNKEATKLAQKSSESIIKSLAKFLETYDKNMEKN